MTTATDTGVDALRARYSEAFGARLPDQVRRLPWDAGRLAAHQREQLRALLACATERSPFHARRLRGIDPGRFELGDLACLPVMTKEQMMAGFDELLAGRLAIAPVSVTAMGEQLTETNRAVISDAFGLPLVNQFASTEGLVGHSDPGGTVLRFASDMCLAELVDEHNQPVPDGTPSAKVLLTNLYNHTQPLIRYELTDRFTGHPADPGSGLLRATVEGGADDTFRYGTVAVDPLVIRSVMVRTPAALEYQVRQTSGGIDVTVVASVQLDQAALADSLGQSLRAAGLRGPQVRVRQVPDIARHPETGKARRFIPL